MITQESLKSLLHYNAETGVFTWISGVRLGVVAGSSSKRYAVIHIGDKYFQSHRLVWLYVHGEFPLNDIDHINGNKHDNRIENLRNATRSENKCNCPRSKRNTSGYKGVDWSKSKGKWRVRIKLLGKSYSVGYFDDVLEAFGAYCMAAKKMHGKFCRTE